MYLITVFKYNVFKYCPALSLLQININLLVVSLAVHNIAK